MTHARTNDPDFEKDAEPALSSPPLPETRQPHLHPNEATDFQPAESPYARASFESFELATVLSHYDIGPIQSITPYTKGSRRAPKVRISTDGRDYILKRRAPGNDDPERVALTHSVQLHLAQYGYPVAPLIGTKRRNNSLLQLDGSIYELFQYVAGRRYNQSREDAREAGRALGLLHQLMTSFENTHTPPTGGFHRVDLEPHFSQLPRAVLKVDPDDDIAMIRATTSELRDAYLDAGERANALGCGQWDRVLVHGDWHPGNLIFATSHVKAVLDFDTVRIEPRAAEVANAALQFGMRLGPADNLDAWPEGISGHRTVNIAAGFNEFGPSPLTHDELAAIPWLMIEAMIAESVVPIAMTGRFARIPGRPFLEMIQGKVRWLQPRAGILVKHLKQAGSIA